MAIPCKVHLSLQRILSRKSCIFHIFVLLIDQSGARTLVDTVLSAIETEIGLSFRTRIFGFHFFEEQVFEGCSCISKNQLAFFTHLVCIINC